MRFVVIGLVLLSLPLFISLLKQYPHKRALAFTAIGLVIFFGDAIRVNGTLIGWPLWGGVARGIEISPIDSLSIALIMTRGRMPSKLPFLGLVGFYSVALSGSMLMSSVVMASFFSFWQFARVALLFVAVAGEMHRREMRDGLLAGLAMGLLLEVGYVAQQKATGVIQATGTMVHQNALGMMTELALMPLLASALGGDRRKLILAGIAAGALVITGGGSRGAIGFAAGGMAALLLLSMIRGVTPTKTRILGLAVLGVALATPVAMITLKDRFGTKSMTVQDDQRPAFERAASAMAADHPLGVGANMYVTTANTQHYADRAGVAWNFANRSASVHNAYLLARAETGWLGEAAVILLLVVPLIGGVALAFRKKSGIGGEIALGSAVALGVNFFHNDYEYAFFIYAVMSLVFINIALIAGQVRLARLQKAPARPRRPASRVVANPIFAGPQPRSEGY